jgi:predicted acyltransferase
MNPSPPAARLASVDVLRGLAVAAMIFVNNPGSWEHVWWPFEHAEWHGCTPTDLIFPSFLFIAGVSLALATGSSRALSNPNAPVGPLLWRALRIIVLGLVLHAVAHVAMQTPHFRLPGVLQRIGLCFGAAALLSWALPVRHWLAGVSLAWAVLWVGYGGLLLAWGPLTPESNPERWLDSRWLGALAYQFYATSDASAAAFDPEGPVGLLGALATTLLGLIAGELLRTRRLHALAWLGLSALLGGWLSQSLWPWNKALWTPSYVLWCAGWAGLALLGAHVAIDRWGWPAWGRAFGNNAITAYAGAWLMTCLLEGTGWGATLYQAGFAWMSPISGPLWPSHLWALAGVLLWWAVARWMLTRGIFVKV